VGKVFAMDMNHGEGVLLEHESYRFARW